MKTVVLNLPTFGFVVATRAMLGAGIGLLLADQLSDDQRKAVGWTLVGVGALTTLPILLHVRGTQMPSSAEIENETPAMSA